MLDRFLFCLLFLLMCGVSHAAENKIVLATGEWPPYVGAELPGQGATAQVVREAFKAVGVDVEFRFFPWSRTVYEAKSNPEIIGYFPEYPHDIREQQYYFSDSVGKSALGFAKRRARNIVWMGYHDLKKFTFATVREYANTKQFDAMVAKGEVVVDESVSDVFVLRKVLAGRVDYGVIDVNVYGYLMHGDKYLYSHRGELEMDPHLLGILNLFVSFKRSDEGRKTNELFNEGLSRIRPMQMQREYLERYSQ